MPGHKISDPRSEEGGPSLRDCLTIDRGPLGDGGGKHPAAWSATRACSNARSELESRRCSSACRETLARRPRGGKRGGARL
eukprot:908551-Pyramimonas_sp.AAC.1